MNKILGVIISVFGAILSLPLLFLGIDTFGFRIFGNINRAFGDEIIVFMIASIYIGPLVLIIGILVWLNARSEGRVFNSFRKLSIVKKVILVTGFAMLLISAIFYTFVIIFVEIFMGPWDKFISISYVWAWMLIIGSVAVFIGAIFWLKSAAENSGHKRAFTTFFVICLILIILFSIAVGVRMTKFDYFGDIILYPIFPTKCYQRDWVGIGRSVYCYPFFSPAFWKEPPFMPPVI